MARRTWSAADRQASCELRQARRAARRETVRALLQRGVDTVDCITAQLQVRGIDVHEDTVRRDLRALRGAGAVGVRWAWNGEGRVLSYRVEAQR